MTITVEWNSSEKQYLIANYYSGWTLSDFRKLKQDTDKHLVSVSYLVDALVIFHNHKSKTSIHRPPTTVSTDIANAFDTAPTNLNNIYVVNAGAIMKIIIKIVQRLVPNTPAQNIQFIESLAQATEMIENSYQSRQTETNEM